jgi:hypothetical protein
MLHVLVVLSSGTEIRVHDFKTQNQMPNVLNLWHLTSQHSLLRVCTSYNTNTFHIPNIYTLTLHKQYHKHKNAYVLTAT